MTKTIAEKTQEKITTFFIDIICTNDDPKMKDIKEGIILGFIQTAIDEAVEPYKPVVNDYIQICNNNIRQISLFSQGGRLGGAQRPGLPTLGQQSIVVDWQMKLRNAKKLIGTNP